MRCARRKPCRRSISALSTSQVWRQFNGLMRIGFPDAEGEILDRLRDAPCALWGAPVRNETGLLPGGDTLLEHMERTWLHWGRRHDRPGWLAGPLLAGLGLERRMACLVSGDTLPASRIRSRCCTLQRPCGVAPQSCVYVGDALRDIEAARAAGMRAVVASFGYISPADEPHLWPAQAWIDDPRGLIDWLGSPT